MAALPPGETYPYRVTVWRLGDAIWVYYPAGAGTTRLSPALFDRLVGSPVTAEDLSRHKAKLVTPLTVNPLLPFRDDPTTCPVALRPANVEKAPPSVPRSTRPACASQKKTWENASPASVDSPATCPTALNVAFPRVPPRLRFVTL